MVKKIESSDDFDKSLKDAGEKLVIVDFYADWCGPCRMIAPILEAYQNDHPEVVIVKVNVDDLGDLSQKHGVSAMPTFILFKKGEKIGELVGANKEKLIELIEKNK